jgi:site-specific recombinase XerD
MTLPVSFADTLADYLAALTNTPLSENTRRVYASQLRHYLTWLTIADIDGDPLTDPAARDAAVRDYRTHLQTVAHRKPTTINTALAGITDFYTRRGLGAPDARRLDLPQLAPQALGGRDTVRWLRAVERWLNPRDRVLALLPLYAGLRIGEAVALNLEDIALSARKGLITVRAGKGQRYREIPTHPVLRAELATWINDERPTWPGADTPALLLNQRGGRLTTRGASNILTTIAADAGLDDTFTAHVLRHTFGTTLIRGGHDIVLVAELMGHARLETTRNYTLPTSADRQQAIDTLPTDQ